MTWAYGDHFPLWAVAGPSKPPGPLNNPSNAVRARPGLSGIRCAYTCSVNAGFACPSHSATALMLSPESSSAEA